jgi:uncharacterized protein YbbC (DUF1343 family)
MALRMQAAAESGVEFIVLDRPNPIAGTRVEGNILDPTYSSFVGMYPIAVRHGLTLRELARMVNEEFDLNCDLAVVEMQSWKRSKWFDQTGLSFVMISWGTASLSKTVVYPGTCFFEGTNLALGLGTLRPCELKGAPWIDAHAWADNLNAFDCPGVIFRPAHFTPWYGPYAGERCGGGPAACGGQRDLRGGKYRSQNDRGCAPELPCAFRMETFG